MKLYHTETQEDYDALMVELEAEECEWFSGRKPTEVTTYWKLDSSETCVKIDKKVIAYNEKGYYAMRYPSIPIIKYKAEVKDKVKIYHTETQADYDALMIKLEEQGCKWLSGRKPTETTKNWKRNSSESCVRVGKKMAMYDKKSYYTRYYPDTPITKYKAKADEKMKFTKENVVKVVDDYFRQADFEPCSDLIAEIYNLDDTTEKVVVPKYIADFYEKRKYCILSVIFDEFKKSEEQKVVDWYIDGRSGGRHVNRLANSQETIAKMHLYGYNIEPEPMKYKLRHKLVEFAYLNYSEDRQELDFSTEYETSNFKTAFTIQEWEALTEQIWEDLLVQFKAIENEVCYTTTSL